MNEGENTGMSNGAIFSSDNMSSDPIEPIVSTPEMTEPTPAPAAPTATPAADAGTDMMPEPDLPERSIITVPRKTSGIAKLGLGRRFHKKEDKPAAPSWGAAAMPAAPAAPAAAPAAPADAAIMSSPNEAVADDKTPVASTTSFMSKIKAPDYFSEAVEDIAIDNEKAARRGSTKRVLKIGGITLAAVAVIAGIIFGVSLFLNGQKTNNARLAWTRFSNYVIYGEEKDDSLDNKVSKADALELKNFSGEKSSFRKGNLNNIKEKYKNMREVVKSYVDDKTMKRLDDSFNQMVTLSTMEEYSSAGLGNIASRLVSTDEKILLSSKESSADELEKEGFSSDAAMEAIDELYMIKILLVKNYKAANCVDGKGNIDYTCVGQKNADGKYLSDYTEALNDYRILLENSVSDLIASVRAIGGMIK